MLTFAKITNETLKIYFWKKKSKFLYSIFFGKKHFEKKNQKRAFAGRASHPSIPVTFLGKSKSRYENVWSILENKAMFSQKKDLPPIFYFLPFRIKLVHSRINIILQLYLSSWCQLRSLGQRPKLLYYGLPRSGSHTINDFGKFKSLTSWPQLTSNVCEIRLSANFFRTQILFNFLRTGHTTNKVWAD